MDAGQAGALESNGGRTHGAFPRRWYLETGLVLPRRGAVAKFLRRLPMTPAERDADIAKAPDRTVMRESIHPRIAERGGPILLVGVQSYTAPYVTALEAAGGTCWTLDWDASVAPYGAPGRHATGCISKLEELIPGVRFSTILMSGVLGFGVNRLSHQLATVESCANALEPGGMLVLGWNDRRVPSILFEEMTARWFDAAPLADLPARMRVENYDHNFAFFRLRSPEPVA